MIKKLSVQRGRSVCSVNSWLTIKIGGEEETTKNERAKKLNRIQSTKYTFLTFIPQNLLEQFRRIANFYFLVMTIVSLLIDSPVSPMTSLLPLAFVIAVTAAKQGYEDFLRYKTDNIVNCSSVTIIRDGKEEYIESQCIVPGDLVLVERDCDVPCDLILIRSSDPNGKCFITTANLDGESNLKSLMVPRDLPLMNLEMLNNLGIIECETPTTDLYSFNGKISITNSNDLVLPLTAENVLLRGSRVKNTECVIGCAIYTGMTTKLQLNSRLTRNKFSSSEAYINRFLLFVLVFLIAIVTVLYFLKRYNEMFVIPHLAYLGPPADSYSVKQFLQDYLSFLILFNYLIPISLYVTIEMHRVFGGLFMEWDLNLYDEATDQPCIVNTSNLNEELGQINILFSDKTGTLTKNEMNFQQCSIAGRKFLFKKTRLQEEGKSFEVDITKFNKQQKVFFNALSVCHTVQVASVLDISNKESFFKISKTEKKLENMVHSLTPCYSFSDITEENRNFYQQRDINTIETSFNTHPMCENSIANHSTQIVSDINPLLYEKTQVEKRKRPQVVKRSPGFTRAQQKVYPISEQFQALEMSVSTTKPLSMQFKRSTSEIHLDNSISNNAGNIFGTQGHRRSQSYGASGAYVTKRASHEVVNRSSSSASRESYAAPNFQRQLTAVFRAESARRKNEIQKIIQTLDYQASSPDEKALVEACAQLGLVFMGDNGDILKIRVTPPHIDTSKALDTGKIFEMNFHRLHVLEFTSDRKKMSVIVKDENGIIWIYTKGAESYIFPLCSNSAREFVAKTDVHVSDFARLGFRTLAIARRRIGEEEYAQFLNDLNEASNSLENRKELMKKCYAKIESNLELLGAAAVEDALQDDVADTLISLQKAGIKIWVLTGDKVETALNIALSCGHIPQNALKYFIIECMRKEDILAHLNQLDREIVFGIGRECALLIDGKSLTLALSETPNEFRNVANKCIAVLCCRLSPLQKSEIVSLIKASPERYNTAAIGDGANDVSMIQEAHVGIGIIGKEGRQAARCADFAFAKFFMLKRLLLVHGHYHTTRLSLLVLYFFYKNIIFMGIMFLFQFHSLFSSSSVYDSLFLTLYNVVYTSVPILFISTTEKPYSEDTLLRRPDLYRKNTGNKRLHWRFFLTWTLNAIYHAIICFYFAFLVFSTNDVILNVGQTAEFSCFGTLLIQTIVIVGNLKLWLESKYLTYWFIVTILCSILAFVVTTVIYNVLDFHFDTDVYWAYNKLLGSLPVGLFCIITVVACLLPDFAYRMGKRSLNLPKRLFYPGKERLRHRRSLKVESTHL